eukprot:TRINITY_DN3130_c1_g1_i1.p1 TRINITY_DN3130_c1_g1~~TRINITY_DN3130_c1_g1_i1.p1  ORF type:complete len:336 (-),score=39.06 TRINITY_DN3130_c1_g1_i1:132-1139(-)
MGGVAEDIEEEGEEEEEEEETSDLGLIASSEDENRVMEWEDGLPSTDDLMPLSQPLIPPELASAFSISPEPRRTAIDVNRASQHTLVTIQRHQTPSSDGLKPLPHFRPDPMDETGNSATESMRKGRRLDAEEAGDSTAANSADDPSARTLKRPRLVWTPQLHKRFVDVVAHLGIKNAVPKTIMQLMNVEGLTRENVASHLQKYRLYLKRMQGLSTEGPSSSDHLFASTPVPQSLHEATGSGGQAPIPMPYPAAPQMMPMPVPMPVMGMPHGGHGHMAAGMQPGGNHHQHHPGVPNYHHGFESNPYHMFREQQQREWSGNKFGSIMSYPHMTPSDK